MFKSKFKRAAGIAALTLGLGVTGAVAPAIVAAPGSTAGPAVAEAATYGWGSICYTYTTAADRYGKRTTYTYRWFTSSTGTYCAHYSTHTWYERTW